MIEKIWFENHPLGWLLWPLFWPLSKLYAYIAVRRRRDYQCGKKASYRSSVPVVVVGNITAGGNGKTPVVIWLVEALSELGLNVGVASRGYGGKAPYYPYLVNEETTPDIAGDEPVLIQRRTQAAVVVAPVRCEAVKLLEQQGVDIVITDDGLQHYALQRDVEIIVIDGQRRFGNQHHIPLGPLREGIHRLAEVDFSICNGVDAIDDEVSMTLAPSQLINLKTGEKKKVTDLHEIVAFAGIGHPPRFFTTLKRLDANVVHTQGFVDHQAFKQSEIEALEQYGQHLVMTEKDAVKCRHFAKNNWWYLPVDAVLPKQDSQRIINRILEVKEQYGSSST
jgi:tetraacyldisaccharide 4'-kinase